MAYDLRIDARDADGEKIGTVYLRHTPEDADKIIRLREQMVSKGWIGRPVILERCGDHHVAYTGCHRLAAAQGLRDGLIQAAYLPDDLSDAHRDLIDHAHDDGDLLTAFIEIGAERDDMGAVIEAMRAEVASNADAS